MSGYVVSQQPSSAALGFPMSGSAVSALIASAKSDPGYQQFLETHPDLNLPGSIAQESSIVHSALAPILPDSGSSSSSSTGRDDSSLYSFLQSALDAEFAASAAQIQAQKDMMAEANSFTAEQNRINRLFQQSSADKAMEFSAAEAQKNRDYQTHMSNTAYQRAVADLQAAGLNPILAVTQGGASSPAGTAGSAFQASGSAGSSASGTASKANAASAWSADQQLLLATITSATGLFEAILKLIA